MTDRATEETAKVFTKKNVRREKRLYDDMGRAKKTGYVSKEMAAEKRYYGDPIVRKMGKIQYRDTKARYGAEAKARSDKEIDKVTRKRAYKR